MYENTFQEYLEFEKQAAKKGIWEASLNVREGEDYMMGKYVYEHLWNALQCGYIVPLTSLRSVPEEVLIKSNIKLEGDVVIFKDIDSGNWIKMGDKPAEEVPDFNWDNDSLPF